MLDRRLAVTGTAVALASVLAIVAALLPEQKAALHIQEQVSGIAAQPVPERTKPRAQPQAEESTEPERVWLYLIREYEGHVAVFGADPEKPEMILDKLVKHLPEYDRIQMQEGIEVRSLEELNARIEDYIG